MVISSIDGLTLSLVKKLKLVEEIRILDIRQVLEWLDSRNYIAKAEFDHVVHTQFRSLEFLPRVAKWLIDGLEIPFSSYSLDLVCDVPMAVWWVDNFGNLKTTVLAEEIGFEEGKVIKTKIGDLKCYSRLKDVPDDERALIIGSSGFKDRQFLEIVIQGKSAEQVLKLDTVNNQLF